MGQYFMPILQFHFKSSIGISFRNNSFDFDYITLDKLFLLICFCRRYAVERISYFRIQKGAPSAIAAAISAATYGRKIRCLHFFSFGFPNLRVAPSVSKTYSSVYNPTDYKITIFAPPGLRLADSANAQVITIDSSSAMVRILQGPFSVMTMVFS